jgi:AraC-like DNA-binding protein
MKVNIEKIEPAFGSSFSIRKFVNQFMFKEPVWHCHPEYEIVYISNGKGKRHINNHISYYDDGDLIFIGPNLPHFGFTVEREDGYTEVVVQLKSEFLGIEFLQAPELRQIHQLFERAQSGLSFNGKTRHRVGKKLLKMLDLPPFEQLMALLNVLHDMSISDEVEAFHANAFTFALAAEDQERIDTIYKYVQQNFKEEVSLSEIAQNVNMSVPAFCRYFKKATSQTFINFVNGFRIAYASKLLREKSMLITDVAHDAGFNNISHFNKQFLKITGFSPRAYKDSHKPVVHLEKDEQLN